MLIPNKIDKAIVEVLIPNERSYLVIELGLEMSMIPKKDGSKEKGKQQALEIIRKKIRNFYEHLFPNLTVPDIKFDFEEGFAEQQEKLIMDRNFRSEAVEEDKGTIH